MPKRNKRKIFGKSSNKNKSVKWNRDLSSKENQQQQQQEQQHELEGDESEDDASANKKDELISISCDSVVPTIEPSNVSKNITKVAKENQHKATITLKVIQFIGEIPNESTTTDNEATETSIDERREHLNDESNNQIKNNDDTLKEDEKLLVIDNVVTVIKEKEEPCDEFGVVPKLDGNKEDEKLRSFDDNYRVESPKQCCWNEGSQSKRHAMLIQEISESSSSEEVKQFLDNEASALELKQEKDVMSKSYRVDSPESSDDNNNTILACRDNVIVHEISESSSSESVKNEILSSISKTSPLSSSSSSSPSTQKACLKIINIKELPSEENIKSSTTKQFECKAEKKLNKAEEAILENLYGNKNLLQIPNLPLDVISEEGSDCGSDIDKQPSNKTINDELDDEVFLPLSSSPGSSRKPPPSSSRRHLLQVTRRGEAEQPLLINTKIIETELNIPEGCKSWETTPVDSELQAELVYLTSTSSSATDLSERADNSDTDEVDDTSEDTETNSLLENIFVPSLDTHNDNESIDMPIQMKPLRQSPIFSSDFYQEINEQKLPDILEEEDEEQAPKSLEIVVECQKQIEDVNKELQQLITEHEEMQLKHTNERVMKVEQEKRNEGVTSECVHETISDISKDKKKNCGDNDKEQRMTPTQFKRKSSTDSSSSANSQCTIIRQNSEPANEPQPQQLTQQQQLVDPLVELCMQSLHRSGMNFNDINDVKIIIQKKHNSSSRNAPQIPIINELELHCDYDNNAHDGSCYSKSSNGEKVITILQVPPEINSSPSSSTSPSSSPEKQRWCGLQSSQIPNLLVALSPLQKSYIDTHDSNTNADVLLDMHKKFVERRAYHETTHDDSDTVENRSNSRILNESHLESVVNQLNQLEDGYFGDRENSVEREAPKSKRNSAEIKEKLSEIEDISDVAKKCRKDENENALLETSRDENKLTVKSADNDISMNSIRNLILREEFFKDSSFGNRGNINQHSENDSSSSSALNNNKIEGFAVKKSELEKELKQLDAERRDLEEELKNLYSLQHFKREELLFNENKLKGEADNKNEMKKKKKAEEENRFSFTSSLSKHSNDDFNDFINSNEKLQQELYNEWQDKVLERYERKLQKTIKLTSIKDSKNLRQDDQLERASSEILRIVPLESEFMTKLKERQKRLSLPIQTEHTSSTESLHHQNEAATKESDDGGHKRKNSAPNIPAHLYEFIKYYEEEIALTKNSDESGIWSECNRSENSIEGIKKSDSPPPPVWTPKSAPQSPLVDRKFRPVPFESPTLPRKKVVANGTTPAPWTQPNYPDKPYQPSISKSSSWNAISIPKQTHSNYIVYRKARAADQINDKVEKSSQNSSSQKEKSISFKTKSSSPVKSNELVHSIKRDFNSETKDSNFDDTRRMTSTAQPKKVVVDGVGPTTREGMPLSLRSEVRDMSRDEWYKKMYNTIHKAKDDDNYVTVKYTTRRGIPYKSNGYASEPEANYDSDYVHKYYSVDRKQTVSSSSQNDEKYGSYDQPVKQNVGQYKIQPGRIENYTPGNSSVSEKEAKQWWDDVMEIFDGHLEQQKLASNYTQGNLSRALKDQGYQSDSTLVFKKRGDVDQLSPVDQKQAYVAVQHGGEVPLHGFRKPLPEKPKVDSVVPPTPPPLPTKNIYNHLSGSNSDSQKRYVENDVNIHYKVPIRYEYKQPIPEDELAHQQAEHMKKVYQEERRRKYLQELQDMSSRRHTDNFTPAQKSPISLNRYDNFGLELPTSKSPVNLPGTIGKALFNFQGQSARELSFKKGDIIYIRRQIDRNWYEGEHNATVGLLPVQYVDIISNDGTRPITTVRKATEGQARAKYNFVAQSDIELSLNKGELVSLTRLVDHNWFEGRIGNRKGIFPISYVDVLLDIGSDELENNILSTTTTTLTKQLLPSASSSSAPITPNSDVVRETKTIRKTEVLHVDTANEPISYRAMFNYRPVNSDELELREGDTIYVLEQCDDGWFVGTNSRNGFFGTFPGNYVKRVY